jgi:tRNA(Leu) C34 or U34 (ribose-2'-O)-methylase TrmL
MSSNVEAQGREHSERPAGYIFSPEDGTLGHLITDRCRDKIFVPTAGCMNLAACVTGAARGRS